MQVQHLRDGAQTVGGINIAAEFAVVVQAPPQFVIGTAFPIFVPIGRQLMAISTLHIDDFAQQTPLSHVQRVELKEVIAAVL